MCYQLVNGFIVLLIITFFATIVAKILGNIEQIYHYEMDVKRKYLGMKFNDYIRVDGDPTGPDITLTWLRNITGSMNMQVLYVVQSSDGNEITSKYNDLPMLCTLPILYDSWGQNILRIYMSGMTANNRCPIPMETINPPSAFSVPLVFDHKITCQTLHFIMDLYPFNEMESVVLLVLEGHIYSPHDC